MPRAGRSIRPGGRSIWCKAGIAPDRINLPHFPNSPKLRAGRILPVKTGRSGAAPPRRQKRAGCIEKRLAVFLQMHAMPAARQLEVAGPARDACEGTDEPA